MGFTVAESSDSVLVACSESHCAGLLLSPESILEHLELPGSIAEGKKCLSIFSTTHLLTWQFSLSLPWLNNFRLLSLKSS